MLRQIVLGLGLIGLLGNCKKQDLPLSPTLFSLQVTSQRTGQPVDSALVSVLGSKGSVLTGNVQDHQYLNGYTDKQGRIQASVMIPRDELITFTCGKVIVINLQAAVGKRAVLLDMTFIQPNTTRLKHEQANDFVAQMDTLR